MIIAKYEAGENVLDEDIAGTFEDWNGSGRQGRERKEPARRHAPPQSFALGGHHAAGRLDTIIQGMGIGVNT